MAGKQERPSDGETPGGSPAVSGRRRNRAGAATSRLRTTFASLGVRNFRLFFGGHMVSVAGTWMQRVAQSWLVLELTGSGTAVGGVTSLQFLPILLIAPAGGVLADRVDRRRLLFVTQSFAAALAATLGILVLTDRVELWMVYLLAFGLGLVGSFDNPARRAFVVEMVGKDGLANAVGLNSVLVNTARVVGPALAGLLIVTVGIGMCFVINATSYLAVIAALALMRREDLQPTPRLSRGRGQIREAVAYVGSSRLLTVLLVMQAVFSVFAYEYEVSFPLFARFTFGGDADTFGLMFASVGMGAIAGGVHTANAGNVTSEALVRRAAAFGICLGLVSVSPTLWVAMGMLVLVGATGTSFLAGANAMLQITTRPEMQGRVVSLRAVAFLGSRPIGAPIVGWVGEHVGPRYAIAMGSWAVIGVTYWARRRLRPPP